MAKAAREEPAWLIGYDRLETGATKANIIVLGLFVYLMIYQVCALELCAPSE